MDHDRNLMLFLNIDSSIVCLFLFEKGYRLFENYQNSFDRWTNRLFTNSCKSFFQGPKNCWRRQFCRANFSLQNVILHWAITRSNKNFFNSYFIRQTCLHQKGAFLEMRVILKNEKLRAFFKDKKNSFCRVNWTLQADISTRGYGGKRQKGKISKGIMSKIEAPQNMWVLQ